MAKKGSDNESVLVDPTLLNKIDQLFALNVGSYINLPQLVVVGDQSSGKSSVLEGLTKLPFPRDSGLCTRFATQIVFRRSPVKQINVSIIPAKDATSAHAEAVGGWAKHNISSLDAASFTKIMIEAQEIMGVSGQNKTKTFSEDVLKLELSAPNGRHLTVVDVPGIFKSTTNGVTTKDDIATVKNMVQGYMDNSRSVMLAVIPANVDIATQEILQMAEDVDPEGIRTLGILTKPDLVDPGAEVPVLNLLANKTHILTHGWHVVLNPGQAKLAVAGSTTVSRDLEEEAFFAKKDPWSAVDKEKVGMKSLEVRLQEILATHIKREFPNVRKELQNLLNERKNQLEKLGQSRDSYDEQLRYLLAIAARFQSLVRGALSTEYASDAVYTKKPSLKIATLVRNRNEVFSEMVQKFGHTHVFTLSSAANGGGKEQDASTSKPTEKKEEKAVRMVEVVTDVIDILPDHAPTVAQPHEDGMFQWLKDLYQNSRGFELGTFQSSILANAMNGQSANWEALTLGYVSDLICMLNKFVTDLVMHVCHDKSVAENLLHVLSDKLEERYRDAIYHAEFLLQIERSGMPTTLASYFSEDLQARRDEAMGLLGEAFQQMQIIGDVAKKLKSPKSVEDQTLQEIYDILASYYEIARKRFVDNIVMQVGGYFLVTGMHTPLKLFGTKFVGDLTPAQLEDIVGEEMGKKRLRKKLLKEISDLEAGKKILR